MLRQYLCWVKTSFQPVLTREAEGVLQSYYRVRRAVSDRTEAARTTVRLLEGLVRLSQAHARLMARGEVTLQDAVVAVWLTEACAVEGGGMSLFGLITSGGDGGGGPNDDPDAVHEAWQATFLRTLAAEMNVC
jgi:DNA helicase MCM9